MNNPDSYSTQNIKHHRNIMLVMTAVPIAVMVIVGATFYHQNAPSSPEIQVNAASYPAEQRPFDPNHPVYQKVPDGAKLLPNSAQIVANIASNNNGFNFATSGEVPPIYVGKPTDPVWTLSGGCGGRSVQFHAPTTIKAGSGSDYPIIILDQANSSFTTSGTQPIEFRMWQATVNSSSRTISANGIGIGSYRNDGANLSNEIFKGSNGPFVSRALGQAEACGQNTGSGESYTVGMIRPIDIQRGYIDHAMRVAAGYLRGPANGNTNNKYWHWPALRTEGGSNSGYLADNDSRVPMGARIFLDKSVDVNAVGNAAAAKLSDAKNKAFAKMFVKALQDYGMIPLDGTGGGSNVYFEGDATAGWSNLIGPKNSYGSYNDISRAVASVLPWSSLRVADSSVFNSYAHSNGTTGTTPNPAPDPSPTPEPSPVSPTTKPAAPTGVKLTSGDHKIVVTWNASPASEQVDTYQVYLNGSLSYTNTTHPMYTITGNPGDTYTVRVSAHNSLGYGPWTTSYSGVVGASAGQPQPTPTPTPAPPAIEVPGANPSDPVSIPDSIPAESDGTIVGDFNGDGLNDVVKDANNDGKIDPKLEIVVDGTTDESLTDTQKPPITVDESKLDDEGLGQATENQDSNTVTFKAGPLPAVNIAKPVAYTFLIAQGVAITGISTYLALTKLALFAGLRARLGL